VSVDRARRPRHRLRASLSEEEDAFGRLLLDHLAGEAGQPILERDDDAGPALSADVFFAEHSEWPAEERRVFEFVRGRILDVGCGAGRHSLEAQRRGFGAVAIDISPGAVEVCRRRGVQDVRLLPLAAVDASLGVFDTVLMMCGNFGLVGTAKDAVLVLRTLHSITTPTARIVLDSVDPHQDNDQADIAYQERNRARGRLPGQVTLRLRYRGWATPWFELLNVSPSELDDLLAATGWHLAHVVRGEPPDYYAVLEKRDEEDTGGQGKT
jgi:SAM-dependent methyltransferase